MNRCFLFMFLRICKLITGYLCNFFPCDTPTGESNKFQNAELLRYVITRARTFSDRPVIKRLCSLLCTWEVNSTGNVQETSTRLGLPDRINQKTFIQSLSFTHHFLSLFLLLRFTLRHVSSSMA